MAYDNGDALERAKRAETLMVFTIAVTVLAISFVVAGRLQDSTAPWAAR